MSSSYKSVHCKYFNIQNGKGCTRGKSCTYYHQGEDDAKYLFEQGGNPPTDYPKEDIHRMYYKTVLCRHHLEKRGCDNSNTKCTFFHRGVDDYDELSNAGYYPPESEKLKPKMEYKKIEPRQIALPAVQHGMSFSNVVSGVGDNFKEDIKTIRIEALKEAIRYYQRLIDECEERLEQLLSEQ